MVANSNEIYIFELLACGTVVSQRRDELWGRKVIQFVDNEAACAALTKGAANSRVALMLVYFLWGDSRAARHLELDGARSNKCQPS